MIHMYGGNTGARLRTSLLAQARMSFDWMAADGAPGSYNIGHSGVARCLKLIRRNHRACHTLHDLQQAAGLKRRGLHKAFVTHLGCTPGVLLRKVRLEYACYLLVHSSLSVDELARRCGYRNANSLWVCFTRDLGVSPNRFRAQQLLISSKKLNQTKSSKKYL